MKDTKNGNRGRGGGEMNKFEIKIVVEIKDGELENEEEAGLTMEEQAAERVQDAYAAFEAVGLKLVEYPKAKKIK